jgi:hypothetical protein
LRVFRRRKTSLIATCNAAGYFTIRTGLEQNPDPNHGLDRALKGYDYPFPFFLAAQRAFIRADSFFLAVALIPGRGLGFLGADFPFHFAQRCFIASEIRLRAAPLM